MTVRLAAAHLCGAVVLVYANSLRVPFLFDDAGAVVNNPTIRDLTSAAIFKPPADGSTTTGRPIVNASFALNYALSGENVWSYHALNIAIHAGAALLLMGLVRRTLVRPSAPSGKASREVGTDSRATTLAFLVALVWALHPLQTESVVCVAQRTESLCGLFYLLTLYAFARGAEPTSGRGPESRRGWWTISLCACLLGMGTKEVMATAPLIVLLYDRTFLTGSFGAAWRRSSRFYIALAATWIPLGWLVAQSGGSRGASAGFGLGITMWTYLLKQAEALVIYLRLSFWPHPLVLDYGTEIAAELGDVAGQAVIVLTLLVATVWALVRKPALGFLGAAFFLILAPSSSVVPLVTQTIAEHRMYLPLAAVVTALGTGIARFVPKGAPWVLSVTAVALGGLTWARNGDYQSAEAIWTDNVRKAPANARAHNNLALVLHQQKRHEAADRHFTHAIELNPSYVTAHYNWGVALLERGRANEAIAQLEAAVRLAPDHIDARVNLGTALVQARRLDEAIAQFGEVSRLRPSADVHYNLGVALVEAGRAADAAKHFHTVLQENPQFAEAHFQLGRIAERARENAAAEKHFEATLRLAPNHAGAHSRLGLLLARAERFETAVEHFRAVIRLQPTDADAHANLGNVLLILSQPQAAVASYEQALRLRPGDQRLRENLELARQSLR